MSLMNPPTCSSSSYRFSDLPNEMFFLILSYLDHRQLIDVMSLSRSFRLWSFQFLLSHFHCSIHTDEYCSSTEEMIHCLRVLPQTPFSSDQRRFYGYFSVGEGMNESKQLKTSFSRDYLRLMVKELLNTSTVVRLDLTSFKQLVPVFLGDSILGQSLLKTLIWNNDLRQLYLDVKPDSDNVTRPWSWDDLANAIGTDALSQLHTLNACGLKGSCTKMLEKLQNIRVLNLRSDVAIPMEKIVTLSHLTHLSLKHNDLQEDNIFEKTNCNLDQLLRNIHQLKYLTVLEVIAGQKTLFIRDDTEMRTSLSNSYLKKLTIVCERMQIESIIVDASSTEPAPLSQSFPHLKEAQYLFGFTSVTISTTKLLSVLVPQTVERLDRLVVSEKLDFGLFSNIKIKTLVVWGFSKSVPNMHFEELVVGTRFKTSNIFAIDDLINTNNSDITSLRLLNYVQLQGYNSWKTLSLLKHLHLEGCTIGIEWLAAILKASQRTLQTVKLERCKIENPSYITNWKALTLSFSALPKLVELRVVNCSNHEFFISCLSHITLKQLEILELVEVCNVTSETLMNFFTNSIGNASLKFFKLTDACVDDSMLQTIITLSHGEINTTAKSGLVTMEGLLSIPDELFATISTFILPALEINSNNIEEYFKVLSKLDPSTLKRYTICLSSIELYCDVFNFLIRTGFNLEQFNVILSDRLAVQSNSKLNTQIADSLKNLIRAMKSLRGMVLDWSPFLASEFDEFKQALRKSGRSCPKLIFPISSLSPLKYPQAIPQSYRYSNSSCTCM
ncbi:hypothetical protein C9374_007262 [Naegleria lovaniensis]|uniref:F-box domain-containing protein n=1 Tax=Naegleria lovaniensis TaxID=51637 RepID=A0AA88H748_NAELO|nr:uncharacterized protein C9374_007262 [Naegleria lovaniensis]KAG2393731.1 hypothetical protein C9374_007262 [Naegleria lovaniensis]